MSTDARVVVVHTPLLIWGPVRSGKTSDLIREAKRYSVRGLEIVTVKHTLDRREHDADGLLRSRDGTEIASAIVTDTLSLDSIVGERSAPIVIAIDEGQFFGDQLVQFVDAAVARGHRVIVAALNGDFRRQPFACIAALASRAQVRSISAICQRCGEDAIHSHKLGGDKSKIIEVDAGQVTYEPRCTGCFLAVE
jgi:thymidine kinase